MRAAKTKRATRVMTFAEKVLGSREAGRRYLRTKNFALGGVAPMDMLKTTDGEQLVLNELQAHSEGGPL